MDKRSITSKINGALGGRPSNYENLYYLRGETWKLVGDNPDYMISDHGRIISLKKNGKLMKTHISQTGYPSVTLSYGEKRNQKKVSLHVLVAREFIPNYENKPEVDHINGDKNDCTVGNLRWVSRLENARAFKKKMNGTTSKYRGVSLCRKSNKWKAGIEMKRKQSHIGTFSCEHDAAEAYNKKALELGFDKSALNKIERY